MSNGQIKLTGAIEPGVVADVMQFVSSRSDRVGYLLVHSSTTDGRVWFKDGAMVAAECGPARDQEAIKRILGLTSGKFAFVDDQEVPERTIFEDTTSVLLECFRQLDEAKSTEPAAEPAAPPDIKPLVEPPDIPPPLARTPQPDDTADGPTRAPTPRTEAPGPAAISSETPKPSPAQQPTPPDIPPPSPPEPGSPRQDSGPTWAPDPLGMAWPETPPAPGPTAAPVRAQEPVVPELSAHALGLKAKQAESPPPPARPIRPAGPGHRMRVIRILRAGLAVAMLGLVAAVAFVLLRARVHEPGARDDAEPKDQPSDPAEGAWASSATAAPPVVIPDEVIRTAWPELRFTGLTKIPGQKGLAIVNDQIIREGDVIEGVTILSVTRTGLLAQCAGDTRFLPFYISSDGGTRGGKRHSASLGQMLRQAFGK
jgi:hypothetical protein